MTVWTEKDLIRIHNGDEILEVIAPGARDPAIAATATNWWLLWTEEGATDTGIEGAVLTGTANAVTPIIKLIATYVFDDQDQPALAPFGPEETIGAWRSAWIDGDASGVVLRRLQTGVAGL